MKLLTNEQICEDLLKWEYKRESSMFFGGWKIHVPGGTKIIQTPPFLTDLQACFDYIVPMLNEKGFLVKVHSYRDGEFRVVLFAMEKKDYYYYVFSGKPATAFIEALSKWWEDQND